MSYLLKLWRKMFPEPRWGGKYRIVELTTNSGAVTYRVETDRLPSGHWISSYPPKDKLKDAEAQADSFFALDVKSTRPVK